MAPTTSSLSPVTLWRSGDERKNDDRWQVRLRWLKTSSCKTVTQAPESTKAVTLKPPRVTLIVGRPGAPLAASIGFPHDAVLRDNAAAETSARSGRNDACGQRHHMQSTGAVRRGSRQVDGRGSRQVDGRGSRQVDGRVQAGRRSGVQAGRRSRCAGGGQEA